MEALSANGLLPEMSLERFEQSLNIARELGLIEDEPQTAIVRIAPQLKQNLLSGLSVSQREKLRSAFIDFNSGFANYLNDYYFNSNDAVLVEEGLKVVHYEMENFVQTVNFAIAAKEDFTNIFHVIDIVLNLGEEHEKRFHLASGFLSKIRKEEISDSNFHLEYGILTSFYGDICFRLHYFDEAISAYEATLDIFQKYDQSSSIAMIYTNLGSVYSHRNLLEQGNRYYEQGIEIMLENLEVSKDSLVPAEVSLIQTYINLGHNHYLLKNHNVAKKISGEGDRTCQCY